MFILDGQVYVKICDWTIYQAKHFTIFFCHDYGIACLYLLWHNVCCYSSETVNTVTLYVNYAKHNFTENEWMLNNTYFFIYMDI